MDDEVARQSGYEATDVTELILRRIAKATHPLTLADVRMADDGGATLDPMATVEKLKQFCGDGLLESWDDPYPICIKVKGHCPPQPVYSITEAGMKVLVKHANHN